MRALNGQVSGIRRVGTLSTSALEIFAVISSQGQSYVKVPIKEKMCPLWPFHIFILLFLLLGPLWLVSCAAAMYAVKYIPVGFDPKDIQLRIEETKEIYVHSEDPNMFKHRWRLESDQQQEHVRFDNSSYLLNFNGYNNWTIGFNVTGNFLGKAEVKLRAVDENGSIFESENALIVTVVLGKRKLDKIFTYSIVVLVSIVYVMFGAAMDWPLVKETIRKPIAPLIGFSMQFLFMPLISYGIGRLLFPCSPVMRLALFLTGLSPGGGASNIWSAAMGANVNLSITMTTISIIAAFGMFPLWFFTLGHQIFEEANLETPNTHIASYLITLLVPVGIGCCIQNFFPRLAKIMNAMLKPLSTFLILLIVIFACVTKFYIFKLFTWRVVLAGLALPWLGYCGGFLAAWSLKQPLENILAIGIETGVQNTGIAIYMIQLVFSQPTADITTVIPVSVAVISPIPLSILSLALKCRKKRKNAAWKDSVNARKEIA